MQPQPSYPNQWFSPAPLHSTHFLSQCDLSMDRSLTTGSKGIYNPALSKHITFSLYSLAIQDISARRIVMFGVVHPTSSSTASTPKTKAQHLPLQYMENRVIHFGVALLELFIIQGVPYQNIQLCCGT